MIDKKTVKNLSNPNRHFCLQLCCMKDNFQSFLKISRNYFRGDHFCLSLAIKHNSETILNHFIQNRFLLDFVSLWAKCGDYIFYQYINAAPWIPKSLFLQNKSIPIDRVLKLIPFLHLDELTPFPKLSIQRKMKSFSGKFFKSLPKTY